MITLIGMIIGIIMAIAVSNAVIVNFFVFVFIIILPSITGVFTPVKDTRITTKSQSIIHKGNLSPLTSPQLSLIAACSQPQAYGHVRLLLTQVIMMFHQLVLFR